MPIINLFKIDDEKQKDFFDGVFEKISSKEKEYAGENYVFTLYFEKNDGTKKTAWRWFMDEFEEELPNEIKPAKAIISIQHNNSIYAMSFGNAFHYVDKFCDKNFAFEFARKFEYKRVKSTSQTNPSSNKNKVINSYTNSEYFEYDSGEAFIKIKATLVLPDDFELFKPSIEVGTSVKLSVSAPSLSKLCEIINYVENKLKCSNLTPIPLFNEIKDENLLTKLDLELKTAILQESVKINISDFDIIGTYECFYWDITEFKLSHGRFSKKVDELTLDSVKYFCQEYGLLIEDEIFNIYVTLNHDSSNKRMLKELLDFHSEKDQCILIKGTWYKYNNDYLSMLENSLNQLECKYDERFNWSKNEYINFIEQKAKEEFQTMEELKKKYYNERVFNIVKSNEFGFECHDRKLVKVTNNASIEIDDFYDRSNSCIFAVKFGNTSSKLSYAVNQMTVAMKAIKDDRISKETYNYGTIHNVAIVLVFDSDKQLTVYDNNKIDINQSKLLVLKNALNEWQKEARKINYSPKVYIGYYQNS